MLHGRVVRPPAIGATLQSVDESSVRDIAGMVKVVRVGNFVGVVSETEWSAIKAAQQLKTEWSKWEGLPDQAKLWDHVRNTKIVKEDITSNVGDASAAMAQGAKRLKATYDFADPHPRIDWTILRGRRDQGWFAHVLDRVASHARPSQTIGRYAVDARS